jgi:hypothetical protein
LMLPFRFLVPALRTRNEGKPGLTAGKDRPDFPSPVETKNA